MFVLDALIAIHIPRVDWIKVKEVEGSLLGDKAQRWVQGGGRGSAKLGGHHVSVSMQKI